MKRILMAGLAAFAVAALAAAADEGSLVQTLSKQLGVSDEQAAGGAGAIFQYAKTALPGADYGKVEKAVPEATDLIKKAPPVDSTTSAVGGVLGKSGSTATGAASLVSSFQKLGLSGDMVGKFTPIVVDYAEQKGGAEVGGILKKVLTPESK
jgi:Protein of unknown function VcgC/VcgE (DUF2780)